MNPSQQKNLIGFSAIARSVMIFASVRLNLRPYTHRFSAIARSVMIFARTEALEAAERPRVSVL